MRVLFSFVDRFYSLVNKVYRYVFFACAVCLLFSTVMRIDLLQSAAVGVLLLTLFFLLIRNTYEDKIMVLLGVLSLCGHFFLAFCFNYFFNAFGIDSLEYHHNAAAMAESLNNGVSLLSIPVYKQYFTHFVAVIYFLFGTNRLLCTFIVSFFTVWAGVLMHLTCKTAKMPKTAGYVASVAIWFMPGFLFFTSDLLKDSLMLFLIALAFFLFAHLIYGEHTKWKRGVLLLLIILTVAVSAFIRFYVFIPVIAGIGLSLFISLIKQSEWRYKLSAVLLIVLFTAVFMLLSRNHLGKWLVSIDKLFELANKNRQSAFAYDTSGIRGYDISTLSKALRELPALCLHYLLQPLPTTWLLSDNAFYTKLLIPDMLIWYALLPLVLLGGHISVVKGNYLGIAALGFFIVFLVMEALLVGNVGALYRYRLQLQEVSFIIVGLGVAQCGKNKKTYATLAATSLAVCMLSNVYIGLRYADGTIDVSNTTLALTYQAKEAGRYTLRYYVDSPKLLEDSSPMSISIVKANTGEMVVGVQYNGAVKGYANLLFDANDGESFVVEIKGNETAAVSDVKMFTETGKMRVLAGRYPLLLQGLYDFARQMGWLVSNTADSHPKDDIFKSGLLAEDEWEVFGGVICYKGVTITQVADGGTQFDFSFECVAESNHDFMLWMHIYPDDINLLSEDRRSDGYVHDVYPLAIPIDTWRVGEKFTDSHVVYLPEGNWYPQFGFWKPQTDESPQVLLNTEDNKSDVSLGWVEVEFEL